MWVFLVIMCFDVLFICGFRVSVGWIIGRYVFFMFFVFLLYFVLDK